MKREELIEEARSWIGTPFHHQASTKGAGCDCAGLVRGVGAAFGCIDPNVIMNYAREPNGTIERYLDKFVTVTKNPKPGDIVLFRIRRLPQHMGFLTDKGTIIHSYYPFGVVEHEFSDKWKQRVVRYYTCRTVED